MARFALQSLLKCTTNADVPKRKVKDDTEEEEGEIEWKCKNQVLAC